ncbi:MAG: DUF559 domain-containing protein [bacterium]|nr:DUF559 domain-containing protein [bacterium]
MQNRRDIPWLQVIRFHKEVTRRAEEAFFALPAGKADSNRWSSLKAFEPADLAGPWPLNENALVSESMARSVRREDVEDLFLGGPCWFRWQRGRGKNWNVEWLPVLYRQVKVVVNAEWALAIVPDQGNWEISPLVYSLLERLNVVPDSPLEEWFPQRLERAEKQHQETGEGLTRVLADIIAQDLPELGELLHQDFPADKVSQIPTPWVLFTPPSSTSAFYRHLMSDFQKLEERFKEPKAQIGGLELLEDIGSAEALPEASVLPIVPLDEWQHRAVSGILQGKPVTVISGPPGTGKSQVVVSSLLNAWAQGTSVLFASNNNQAVDVVRERVEKFEGEFPIAIRAGSKRASNLEDALRRTLNVIAAAGGGATGTANEGQGRQGRLVSDKQELQKFLDSKLPQRLDEALRSALNAYSNYQQAVADLESAEEAARAGLRNLGYSGRAESFADDVLTPLENWVQRLGDARREIGQANERRESLAAEIRDAKSSRDRAAQSIGLDSSSVRSWEWLTSGPGPELLEAWLGRFRTLLSTPLERSLESYEWKSAYEAWSGSKEAKAWATGALDVSRRVAEACEELEPATRRVEEAREGMERQRAVVLALGVPESVAVEPDLLVLWTSHYSEYCTLPATRGAWVPWSRKSRLGRRLKACERKLRSSFPLSLWQRIGRLDDASRSGLGEVVEQTESWLETRAKWQDAQAEASEIEKSLAHLRAKARAADAAGAPDTGDLGEWRAFANVLSKRTELCGLAAAAWTKRETRDEVLDSLRSIANEYQATGSGIPLKEAWVEGQGLAFNQAVLALGADSGVSQVVAARQALYSEPFTSLIETWRVARELEGQARAAEASLAQVSSEEQLIRSWWERRPAAVVGEFGSHDRLPVESDEPLRHLETCGAWFGEWRQFVEKVRIEKQTLVADEREWARQKLAQAADEIPTGAGRKAIQDLVGDVLAGKEDEWPTEEITQAFVEFNPERLRARIEQIDQQLEALSFDLAKEKWVTKLADDPTIQEDLSTLLKHYKTQRQRITEDDYELFQRVLRAVPIWITTALSPQALPLVPGLFDLLIIDEATQCTLTNLLPLVYRAKRLVVIGDPEQLPAIPTLTSGAEQALARTYEVEEWLDLLGHAENNVYSTAVQCLPKRYSDVIALLDHYRSHPLIIGFANQHVYQKRLRLRKEPGHGVQVPGGPGVHGVNIQGACERGDRGRSWRNRNEAEKVVELVQQLRGNDQFAGFTIGVVSPFRPQVDLIETQLDGLGMSRGVATGTAHRFQGDERDVMIFSPVVAKGITDGAARWVESPRNLINVAVTRAREALFFVADYAACRRQPGILGELTRYAEDVTTLRETSPAELDLFSWMAVQGWSPEVHKVIGDIEVDFVLLNAGARLAVEVDGDQHDTTKAQDAARDAFLQARGYNVLRFPARAVRETPASVIREIATALEIDLEEGLNT